MFVPVMKGQKAVVLTDESWEELIRYLNDRKDELPEKIKTITTAIIVETELWHVVEFIAIEHSRGLDFKYLRFSEGRRGFD